MSQVIYLSEGANESDIKAALALIGNGGILVLPENAIIEITDGINIDISSRDITIDLNGSVLKQASDVTVIAASGSMGPVKNVAIDVSGENTRITYDSLPANLKVGDWIKVASDDELPHDNRNTELPTRLGQAMQVTAIDGNTVELAGQPLYGDQYVTNVRAATMSSGTLKLTNGTVQGDQSDGTWLSVLVNVRDAIGAQIDHLRVQDGNSMGINLVNNVNALVTECVVINLKDDTPNGFYGYGVHSAGSLNTTVNGLYTERVRHSTDNNGVATVAGDPYLSKYGADIGMTVTNSVAYYSSAFSYSFHSEGRNAVLDNVMSVDSHGFVGLRGVGNTVVNSASVGDERGFQFLEYGYGDSRDMLIDGVIIREARVYVYNVEGDAANNVIQNSYLEYDYRTGNPGTISFLNTVVIKTDGVDDDYIVGTVQADRLLGGRGSDILFGGDGDDYVWGGEGNDLLTGGAGSDRFVFDRLDSIDIITDFEAGEGGDKLDLSILGARLGWRGDYLSSGHVTLVQSGSDVLLQLTADRITVALLQNVVASSIVAANIQQTISGNGSTYTSPPLPTVVLDPGSIAYAKGKTIVGTAANDIISPAQSVGNQPLPTPSADTITGGDGDDYIDGFAGADTITGGNGNDTVVYYGGVKSKLQGGSGRDTLILDSTDVIDLSAASDQSEGLPVVSGFDDVDGRGSSLPLTVFGNANNNNIWGGSGDDRIATGGGNDRIDGGEGEDVALLTGNREDYSFIRTSADTWRVQDVRLPNVTRVYFTNVERVSFDDQLAFMDALNRPPTDITLSNATVLENASAGALVGVLIGIDPDVSEINTFTILNDPDGLFVIDGYNLRTTQPLDFEMRQTIDLEIQLTDSDFHTIVRTLTITIGDQNDSAPEITSAAEVNTPEDQRGVLDLTATDADTTGEPITFSIKPDTGDAAYFTIEGSTLSFIDPPQFDSATHGPTYTLTLIASDGVNTSEQVITVTVADTGGPKVWLGTDGDDQFVYSAPLAYDRIDGRGGSDTFAISGSLLALSNSNGEVAVDLDNDGSVDFTIANVENLTISGGTLVLHGSLAGTALSSGVLTLTGTGSADTLDASVAGVRVTLHGGAGNDVLKGSALADTLKGGAGSDKLYANGGADTLIGGAGNDIYYLDDASQLVIENSGEGTDRIIIKADYTLGDNIEDLTFAGSFGHTGAGNALRNTLVGSSGDDVLDGAGGADTLTGGKGKDRFVFSKGEANGDVVTDFEGSGISGGDVLVFNGFGKGTITRIGTTDSYLVTADAAHGGVTETIRLAGVTNLAEGDYEFVPSSTGANLPPTDILASNLSVRQAAAVGTVIGDLSAIDPDAGDVASFVLIDGAGGLFALTGNSLVLAGSLTTSSSLAYVITVKATDPAGNSFTKSLTVTVKDDETVEGTAGDDIFTYSGSVTYTRWDGLAGTDTLNMTAAKVGIAANGTDVTIDIDLNGTINFSTANVEWLTLSGTQAAVLADLSSTALTGGGVKITGTAGADTLDAAKAGISVVIDGGVGNDVIQGSSKADILIGGAGADKLYANGGADILRGGAGNDAYYLDDPIQQVIEYDNEGTDRVIVKFDYALGDNIEDLTFAGTIGRHGIGNALNNRMTGSTGNDVLEGLDGADTLIGDAGNDLLIGGAGADTLTGGAGADTIRFTILETSAQRDTVTDFTSGVDRIEFARGVFAGFAGAAAGSIDSAAFYLGAGATAAEHRIIYDQASGVLSYDPDGAGGEAQVQLAVLTNKADLQASDLFLI
jgi:Ca2+-binding RTX toxin-like protein